jgi:hypothetical protein
MPWGAAVGAAITAVTSDSGGGAGSSTVSKEPWSAAAPWIQENLNEGQRLQGYYSRSPFNAAQVQAYGNMADQGAYMRALVPSLLGQVNQQGYYDRSNPTARPQAYQFPSLLAGQAGMPGTQAGGLNPATLIGDAQAPVGLKPVVGPPSGYITTQAGMGNPSIGQSVAGMGEAADQNGLSRYMPQGTNWRQAGGVNMTAANGFDDDYWLNAHNRARAAGLFDASGM